MASDGAIWWQIGYGLNAIRNAVERGETGAVAELLMDLISNTWPKLPKDARERFSIDRIPFPPDGRDDRDGVGEVRCFRELMQIKAELLTTLQDAGLYALKDFEEGDSTGLGDALRESSATPSQATGEA